MRPDTDVFVLCARGANQYGPSAAAVLASLGVDHAEFERLLTKVVR